MLKGVRYDTTEIGRHIRLVLTHLESGVSVSGESDSGRIVLTRRLEAELLKRLKQAGKLTS